MQTASGPRLKMRFAVGPDYADTRAQSEIDLQRSRLQAFYATQKGVYIRNDDQYDDALRHGSVLVVEFGNDIVAASCVFVHRLADRSGNVFELGGDSVDESWERNKLHSAMIAVRTLQQVRVGEKGRPLFSVVGRDNPTSRNNFVRCGFALREPPPPDVVAAAQYAPKISSRFGEKYQYFDHARELALAGACAMGHTLLAGLPVRLPGSAATTGLDVSDIPMLAYWLGGEPAWPSAGVGTTGP